MTPVEKDNNRIFDQTKSPYSKDNFNVGGCSKNNAIVKSQENLELNDQGIGKLEKYI